MAKKTKVVSECCGPAMDYKPRLYLNLEGQDVAQIKGLKVGEEVEIRVTGRVVGLSQRERPDHKTEGKVIKTGDIDLEGYKVQVMGEEENEFIAAAKEEAGDE